jgi:3-phenylpropionate/trans-cinnamate dioxygenase ferredoxin reductase component
MAGAGVVIIGAGQAGLQTAVELRAAGYSEPVVLVGAEDAQPYHRPPLSKAYLTGEKSADSLLMRGEAFYAEQNITRLFGVAATAIDRAGRVVLLADGRSLPFDHAVLATGADARRLVCDGANLDGVVLLRSKADSDDLRTRLKQASSVVVIGGGFIGLEVAASASKLGKSVTVLEMAPRLMARAVGEGVSAFFAAAHRGHGVDVRLGEGVSEIMGTGGKVSAVRSTTGTIIPCGLVVAGIGVTPNSQIAAEAGLTVANGIVVDASQRTSDPAILALGDCCAFPGPDGSLLRLESVQNAVDQAKVVAAAILGRETRYDAVPWFWSDQYDLKLQMVGLSAGADHVIERGDKAGNRFSAFYFRQGRLIAIDSINRPADHMRGRKALAGPPVGEADIDTLFAELRRA